MGLNIQNKTLVLKLVLVYWLSQLVEKLLLSFMFGHSEDDVAQNI